MLKERKSSERDYVPEESRSWENLGLQKTKVLDKYLGSNIKNKEENR